MNTLDAVLADAGHVNAVLTSISSIDTMGDPGDACERLRTIAGQLGFESAAFATFLQNDPWHQSYRFLLACRDDRWCASYQRNAWFADDPWLAYARTCSTPAKISDIDCRSDKQREIVGMARQYGVSQGLIVPCPPATGISRLGVLMLGCADSGYLDTPAYSKLKVIARSLASELLDWYVSFMREELRSAAKLTDADVDLLRCEREGMSTKDIERRLGFHSAAINSRFQRIIAKMQVSGRRAASQVAAEYGLI